MSDDRKDNAFIDVRKGFTVDNFRNPSPKEPVAQPQDAPASSGNAGAGGQSTNSSNTPKK